MLVTLGISQVMVSLLVALFLLGCVLLILTVLIQRPQGGGLSGAFGAGAGSGSGQTAFGTKTGDALTYATIGMFVIYLLLAIGLNFAARPTTTTVDDTAVVEPLDENGATGEPTDGATPEGDAETDGDAAPDDSAETGAATDPETTGDEDTGGDTGPDDAAPSTDDDADTTGDDG